MENGFSGKLVKGKWKFFILAATLEIVMLIRTPSFLECNAPFAY